jgi:hypothetical protein
MRNDHRKTSTRKEQVTNQKISLPAKQRKVAADIPGRGNNASVSEKPIKGKDMDLLNYTDL